MVTRRRLALIVLVAAASGAAAGALVTAKVRDEHGAEGAGAPTTAPTSPIQQTGTATTAEPPSPQVEVAWFYSSEEPLLRFVALIRNPAAQTLMGVRTEWVAYDDAGSIVGSFEGLRPPIPARATVPYAGGAGGINLTGVPARVEVRIVDTGRYTADEAQTFQVRGVRLAPEEFSEEAEFQVRARVTTGPDEVRSSAISLVVVLRNANGEIVGGDFADPENLPDRIAPRTTFNIEVGFIRTTARPTRAEVIAYG